MTPRLYTELFFLDEATAFSAGHRPCFECRREAAQLFRSSWVRGNAEYNFNDKTSIYEIDDVLHRERTGEAGVYLASVGELPDGVFVIYSDQPHLVADGLLYPWSPFGYGESLKAAADVGLSVITPRSTVNAFRMGYVPQMGVSLDDKH